MTGFRIIEVDIRVLSEETFSLMGVATSLAYTWRVPQLGSVSWSSWSPIHGRFNADLRTFERDFLPYALTAAGCTSAVRVHSVFPGKDPEYNVERWNWWRGSTLREMADLLVVESIMVS